MDSLNMKSNCRWNVLIEMSSGLQSIQYPLTLFKASKKSELVNAFVIVDPENDTTEIT